MSSELRTMLARLADEAPPVEIDLARQIAEGRRRVRRRNLIGGLAGIVALGLLGGLVATTALQTADDTPQPAGQPTPSEPSQPQKVSSGKVKIMSTARSQALAAQLALLAPDITRVPGAVRNDGEDLNTDGTPRGHLRAAAVWTYPATDSATNSVDLTVEVATGNERVPTVCDGMDGPPAHRCSEVRTLTDGSTAFIHDYTALGGNQHEVRLVRPNGTQVYVGSGAQMPPGSTHDSLIARDRVVEIAQQITVLP
jgi:hypothetical protein